MCFVVIFVEVWVGASFWKFMGEIDISNCPADCRAENRDYATCSQKILAKILISPKIKFTSLFRVYF